MSFVALIEDLRCFVCVYLYAYHDSIRIFAGIYEISRDGVGSSKYIEFLAAC